MPFQKGNKLAKGFGRKGYEFEVGQLKRMSKILNGILTLVEKILSGKATTNERIRYEDLVKMALKIMDKLHANRQFLETEYKGEIKLEILNNKELDARIKELENRISRAQRGKGEKRGKGKSEKGPDIPSDRTIGVSTIWPSPSGTGGVSQES